MNEGDSSDMQGCFVYMRRTSAVPLQALGNHPQKDAQHHIEHGPVALHEVAQPLGHRQYPLAHRQTGENMIGQMHRRLHHAPRVARGAHASTFAGKGHEVVVRAVSAAGADKAVGKDAAFEVFAKRLAHIGLGGAQGALPIELACTGQVKPGRVVLGYRLVQQRTLRMARVVEFGLRYGRHKYCVNTQYFATSGFACKAK